MRPLLCSWLAFVLALLPIAPGLLAATGGHDGNDHCSMSASSTQETEQPAGPVDRFPQDACSWCDDLCGGACLGTCQGCGSAVPSNFLPPSPTRDTGATRDIQVPPPAAMPGDQYRPPRPTAA